MAMVQADMPGRQRDDFWDDFNKNQRIGRMSVELSGIDWSNCEWVPEVDRKKAERESTSSN